MAPDPPITSPTHPPTPPTMGAGRGTTAPNPPTMAATTLPKMAAAVQQPSVPNFESPNLPPNHPERFIKISDADSQVTGFSKSFGRGHAYPKVHHGRDGIPITSPSPWREHPLIAGTSEPYRSGPRSPGPVRAIYNENERDKYDVFYHDPTKRKPRDFSPATRHD